MKILQAVVIRRDGKWSAQAVTQDGVVNLATGETLTEALDMVVAESTNYEQCPNCNGAGYFESSHDDPDARTVTCEMCGGARIISDELALELVDAEWSPTYGATMEDSCNSRADLLIQAARQLRRQARAHDAQASVLDRLIFADAVKELAP